MTVEVPLSFIITMSAINSGAIVAFVGVVVYLALRLGRLPTRQEHNELRNELRNEFKADMAQLRADIREDMAQLRAEFRHSHQQIMLALVNHSHREDGQAVFALPPEMETAPAVADN